MMESENNRPININNYNSSEGKLRASIKWLITRIYENNDVPDNLRNLFYRDNEGNLQLRDAVIKCLTSGTFYTQAASKILHNNVLVTQSIGAVLGALSSIGVDVREADGSYVTETALVNENPLKINSHLAFIDSLMMAHLKAVISIERVVQAISAYTPVEKREEPLDCVDALLFWINKICLLVRDDVERNEIALESNNDATIPEMEDLYEDLCDGTCVCVLVSFYQPHDMPLQRIYFNDPMHINDCRFNLGLLKEFCETVLPFNPFHFEIEDILYLHESLQPNVNVFLADLFHCFESEPPSAADTHFPAGQQYVAPQQALHHPQQQQQHIDGQQLVSPTQRRFVPITGIPDLRTSGNAPTTAAAVGGAPTMKLNRIGHGSSQRDRAISMASVDSLMTNRSGDSLMFPSAKPQPNFGPNTTHFGDLPQDGSARRGAETNDGCGASSTLPKFSAAEAKLQMGELRRQYEANKLMQNAANEEKRSQASKDAFFRVMSKSAHDETPQMSESARDNYTSREDLSAQLHSLQEQINNIKLNPKLSVDQGRQTPGMDSNTLPYGTSPSSAFMSSTNTLSRQIPHQSLDQVQSPYAHPSAMPNHFMAGNSGTYTGPSSTQFMSSQGMYMDSPQPPLPQQQPFMLGGHGGFMQSASSQQNISQYSQGGGYMASNTPISHHQQQPHQSPYYSPMNPLQQQPYFAGGHMPQYPQYQQSPHSMQMGGQFPSQHYVSPMLPPHQQQLPPQQQIYSPTGDFTSPLQHSHPFPDHTGASTMMMSPPAVPPHQQPPPMPFDGYGNDGSATFRLHQPNASTSRLDPPLELNRNLTNWGLTYRMGERAPRKSWSKNTFRSEHDISGSPTSAGGARGNGDGGVRPEEGSVLPSATMSKSNGNGAGGGTANGMSNSTSMTDAFGGRRNRNETDEMRFQATPNNRNAASQQHIAGTAARSASDRRPMSAFIADDANASNVTDPEMTAEMQAKRRALLLNQMRRKERIVAQCEEKEQEMSERRQLEQQKLEQAEQRKLERELKRQRLLEDYKRKKMEQDLGEPASASGGSASARMSASSTTSLNRGHSQPPIGRPKSQSNMSLSVSRMMQRSGRTHSNVGDNNENSTPRVSVASTAEPTLKLFAKHQPKSNRSLMMNALQYRIFPGAVTAEQKSRVQCALAQSDSKHFLVLFRDHKCQYRGMYTWDQISDTVYKIDGTGPKICREDAMVLMFKYDSGAKLFNQIPTKHLSATIDGFTIDEQFWQKTRIPHS